MGDILTQLQSALDQLLIQFYASLRYLSTHHPSSSSSSGPSTSSPPAPAALAAPSQPSDPTTSTTNQNPQQLDAEAEKGMQEGKENNAAAASFTAAQRELAADLIAQSARIRALILALPATVDTVDSTSHTETDAGPGLLGEGGGGGGSGDTASTTLETNPDKKIQQLDTALQTATRERAEWERKRGEWVARVEGVVSASRR